MWQPIETAPKVHGMRILLFGSRGIIIGYWRGAPATKTGGWWQQVGDGGELLPTHWMPLPEPPQ